MIEQNRQKLLEIASDILDLEIQLDQTSDSRAHGELLIAIDNLKEHTRLLYDALVVMRHELTLQQESAVAPILKSAALEDADDKENPEALDHRDEFAAPDGLGKSETFDQLNQAPIFEPSTEKIKDIVAQMPPETQQVDALFEGITDGSQEAQEVLSHYQEEIEFEPVTSAPADEFHSGASIPAPQTETMGDLNSKTPKPKSVNDQWGRLAVGLNDRTAFVQHLFLGDVEGFNRVLSQINTFETLDEVNDFLRDQVKPEYNNWDGKEAVADRLMRLVQQRFNA